MTIEASLRLPQGIGDVDRFIQEFQIGKEAEATSFHAYLEHRHCEAVRQEMLGLLFSAMPGENGQSAITFCRVIYHR